jgi:hypothetical protein
MALYREAIGIADNAYKFFALFRILNITLRKGEAQITWIDGQLPTIPHPAQHRAEDLRER